MIEPSKCNANAKVSKSAYFGISTCKSSCHMRVIFLDVLSSRWHICHVLMACSSSVTPEQFPKLAKLTGSLFPARGMSRLCLRLYPTGLLICHLVRKVATWVWGFFRLTPDSCAACRFLGYQCWYDLRSFSTQAPDWSIPPSWAPLQDHDWLIERVLWPCWLFPKQSSYAAIQYREAKV